MLGKAKHGRSLKTRKTSPVFENILKIKHTINDTITVVVLILNHWTLKTLYSKNSNISICFSSRFTY